MSERREIAAGPDRAFFWNDRRDMPIEHLAENLDDFEANSAQANGKHICAQQHHCAHLRFRERITNSASVTANKVQLKFGQLAARDANVGQLAEAGADTVHDCVTRYDIFDDLTRSKDPRACGRG